MLSIEQRYNICLMAETHPKWTQQELARWAYETFQLAKIPSQGTVSRILAKKETYMNSKGHEKDANRIRKPNNLLVRKILQEWISQSIWNGIPITSPILQETAHAVWQRIPAKHREGNGSFSYKWISNFLSKMDVNISVLDEEMPKTPKVWSFEERVYLKEYFAKIPARDIFTLDETFLAYNLPLDYAQYETSSIQRKIEVATVMLCANLDGSEKLKPLVVGKYNNYKSFRNYFPNDSTDSVSQSLLGEKMARKFDISYHSNRKSWLTGNLFHDWLVRWDKRLVAYNRKIWIVLDDSCSHRIINLHLQNITLVYTSANSRFLPFNWGVLDEFKTRYRIQQYEALIKLQKKIEEKTEKPFYISFEQSQLTMSNAFKFIKQAWDCIPIDTIKANWKSSGIIPANMIQLNENVSMAFKKNEALEAELNSLCHIYHCIKQWEYEMLLDLNIENKNNNFLSTEELVESTIAEEMEPGDDFYTNSRTVSNTKIPQIAPEDDLEELPSDSDNDIDDATSNNRTDNPNNNNNTDAFSIATFSDTMSPVNTNSLVNNLKNDNNQNNIPVSNPVTNVLDPNFAKFLDGQYMEGLQNNFYNVSDLIDRPGLFLGTENVVDLNDVSLGLAPNYYINNVFNDSVASSDTGTNPNSALSGNITNSNNNFVNSVIDDINPVINNSINPANNSAAVLNENGVSVPGFEDQRFQHLLDTTATNPIGSALNSSHTIVSSNMGEEDVEADLPISVNSRQSSIDIAKSLLVVVKNSNDIHLSKNTQSELRATYRSLIKRIKKNKRHSNSRSKKTTDGVPLESILGTANQNIDLGVVTPFI